MSNQNGKGDSPRNIFSEEYRSNYDDIFRKPSKKSAKKLKYPLDCPWVKGAKCDLICENSTCKAMAEEGISSNPSEAYEDDQI